MDSTLSIDMKFIYGHYNKKVNKILGNNMGHSLARCLFQKGGEFRPTKRKRRRAWTVGESGNDIGRCPMSIPSTSRNARFI